jgi:hypothetical protein
MAVGGDHLEHRQAVVVAGRPARDHRQPLRLELALQQLDQLDQDGELFGAGVAEQPVTLIRAERQRVGYARLRVHAGDHTEPSRRA